MTLRVLLGAAVAARGTVRGAGDPSRRAEPSPSQPTLDWEPRSDWLSAKAGCASAGAGASDEDLVGAVGDGVADDTVALQRCLDNITNSTGGVLHIPPGTYKLTSTLRVGCFNASSGAKAGDVVGCVVGAAIYGHGAATVLRWAGEANGTML